MNDTVDNNHGDFDLDRMEEMVTDEFDEMPDGITTVTQFDEWLRGNTK